jgi:hypothetical protein
MWPWRQIMSNSLEAELDRFREGLFSAFNRGDYKVMLEQYCHKDVVATWQDGTTSKGHEGVLAEFDKLLKFIAKMTVQPTTDMRLILHDGKLAVSSGNMHDTYELVRGGQGIQHGRAKVALQSRWSATLIKEEGKWLLVSFSASTNAFNNEVVHLYLRKTMLMSAGIASVIGLIIGIIIGMLIR